MRLAPLGGGRSRYSTIGPLAATRLLAAACVIGAGASAAQGAEKTGLAGRPAPATLAVPSETETTKHLGRVAGMIGDNLYETSVARGVPPSVMERTVKMLGYVVDFQRDLRPRHRYEILYEVHLDKEGAHRRVGKLAYASLKLDERSVGVWRYTPPGGEPDYFDSEGRSVRTGLLRTPVDGAMVSSGFGLRKHPILGYSRMHRGIDFAVPKVTPIYAAGAGEVEEAGRKGAYGNYVRIRHEGGYSTAYAHLSEIEKGLPADTKVTQGQIIGRAGSTGLSTVPHLHYEVWLDEEPIDPASVDFETRLALAGDVLAAFRWQAALVMMKPVIRPAKPAEKAARKH